MEASLYIFLGAAIVTLAAVYCIFRLRLHTKEEKKQIPESYFGAIRVTDRNGRDMLIMRKEDGSFEMVEEEKVRK